jgi:hypothetical protein
MLEKEYSFYEANKDELLKQYLGRFLLIHNEKIVGDFSSEKDAYIKAQQNGYALGSFLIQECKPDVDLKETFNSRVIFYK